MSLYPLAQAIAARHHPTADRAVIDTLTRAFDRANNATPANASLSDRALYLWGYLESELAFRREQEGGS